MKSFRLLRTNPWLRDIKSKSSRISDALHSPYKKMVSELSHFNDPQIIDAGANVGQFGVDMRRSGFTGHIFSYEPVSETFQILRKTIDNFQPWSAFNLALGSTESQMEIFISGNAGLSSSLLEMNDLHLINFPESKTVAKERVQVSTLNQQITLLGLDPSRLLLKMDVQGYEFEVLKGANMHLEHIPLCYLEISLKKLYLEESSFIDLLILLREYGHEVVDVYRGVKSNKGELLQVDLLTQKI